MLDTFLSVAYRNQEESREKLAFEASLKKLPVEDLQKIASGEVPLEKLAGSGPAWLDQFKGTPLFDQALELEQMDIQVEAERLQQGHTQIAMSEHFSQKDQLRLQKRLLEIHLAQLESQGQVAGGGSPSSSNTSDSRTGSEWLERFVGTPLFEHAVQLEQAELQQEAVYLQSRLTEPEEKSWLKGSLIEVQKRALEVQLIQMVRATGSNTPPPSPDSPSYSPSGGGSEVGRGQEGQGGGVGQFAGNNPAGLPSLPEMQGAMQGEASGMPKADGAGSCR